MLVSILFNPHITMDKMTVKSRAWFNTYISIITSMITLLVSYKGITAYQHNNALLDKQTTHAPAQCKSAYVKAYSTVASLFERARFTDPTKYKPPTELNKGQFPILDECDNLYGTNFQSNINQLISKIPTHTNKPQLFHKSYDPTIIEPVTRGRLTGVASVGALTLLQMLPDLVKYLTSNRINADTIKMLNALMSVGLNDSTRAIANKDLLSMPNEERQRRLNNVQSIFNYVYPTMQDRETINREPYNAIVERIKTDFADGELNINERSDKNWLQRVACSIGVAECDAGQLLYALLGNCTAIVVAQNDRTGAINGFAILTVIPPDVVFVPLLCNNKRDTHVDIVLLKKIETMCVQLGYKTLIVSAMPHNNVAQYRDNGYDCTSYNTLAKKTVHSKATACIKMFGTASTSRPATMGVTIGVPKIRSPARSPAMERRAFNNYTKRTSPNRTAYGRTTYNKTRKSNSNSSRKSRSKSRSNSK